MTVPGELSVAEPRHAYEVAEPEDGDTHESKLAGLWSLIKRSPRAKIKRKTFEVAGPGVEGAMPLDARARQVFQYFTTYNYQVKSKGEIITFEGNFRASVGEASCIETWGFILVSSVQQRCAWRRYPLHPVNMQVKLPPWCSIPLWG